MWQAPESGKPVDFDSTTILTVEDAEDALLWLKDRLSDIEGQLSYREVMGTADPKWVSQTEYAASKIEITIERVGVLKARLQKAQALSRAEAFLAAAQALFSPEDLEDVWALALKG